MVPTTSECVAPGDAKEFDPSTTAAIHVARLSWVGALLRKLALTIAVWTLYVPHLIVLKMLGPRLGLRWARCASHVHWWLTFLGAERSTRAILRSVYPQVQTKTTPAVILRKHLELKHECFARIRAFGQQRAFHPAHDIVWEVDDSCRERVAKLRSSGRGLIIVGFHFGFFRLSASAIARVFPGCDAVHVSHRVAHYQGETINRVARLAHETALTADQ
jgi:lauroyl/myristoyl acyltransferase